MRGELDIHKEKDYALLAGRDRAQQVLTANARAEIDPNAGLFASGGAGSSGGAASSAGAANSAR